MLAPPRDAAQRVATGRLDRALSPHSLKPDQAAKLCVPLANKYGVPAPNRQFVDIVKARISNHILPLAARSKAKRVGGARTSRSPAQAASLPQAAGQISPRLWDTAPMAAGNTPATAVRLPSSANSPSAV